MVNMIKIESKYVPWKDELSHFVSNLAETLSNHLPPNFSKKIDEKINGIVLGVMPPYMGDDVGAYYPSDKKIYLSFGLLQERDPKKMAEVEFHEFGHPLLNDELDIDEQISADFLAIYSVGSCDVFKERKNESMKYYKIFEEEIKNILGDNNEFLNENKRTIENTKKEWYPRLQKEIMDTYGIDPRKISINRSVKNILDKIYPEYKQIIREHENDDNPLRNLYRVRLFRTMEEILTTPIKDLSGYAFNIPRELARRIREKTGIFIGFASYMTPRNDIPYTLEEVIERGMKFSVKHPLFE